MTNEVRVVKNLLKYHFPNENISVTLRRAKQYYTTSDKIIVTVPNAIITSVFAVLCANTKNMKIFLTGNSVSISGISNPQVFNVVTNTFWDMDMTEFIEIKSS